MSKAPTRTTQRLLHQLYQQQKEYFQKEATTSFSQHVIYNRAASSSTSSSSRQLFNRSTVRSLSANASLFQKQQRQQYRNMVTITQTKAGETPPPSSSSSPPPQMEATPPTPSNHKNDVTITPSCISRIQHLSSTRSTTPDPDLYLRLYVDAGGCSGFQYKFNLESNNPSSPSFNTEDGGIDPDDDVIYSFDNDDGTETRVVIDKGSLEYVKGSTIDYVQDLMKSSFEVRDNPNSENACGCGSSFAMKKFESNPALD